MKDEMIFKKANEENAIMIQLCWFIDVVITMIKNNFNCLSTSQDYGYVNKCVLSLQHVTSLFLITSFYYILRAENIFDINYLLC